MAELRCRLAALYALDAAGSRLFLVRLGSAGRRCLCWPVRNGHRLRVVAARHTPGIAHRPGLQPDLPLASRVAAAALPGGRRADSGLDPGGVGIDTGWPRLAAVAESTGH